MFINLRQQPVCYDTLADVCFFYENNDAVLPVYNNASYNVWVLYNKQPFYTLVCDDHDDNVFYVVHDRALFEKVQPDKTQLKKQLKTVQLL